jgi:oxygen-dependent protoporphyrinogen oxidase
MAAIGPVLGIRGEPTFSRVYRFERASAQHEVGHVERMARIDRRLALEPGLYVTGSGFRGVGIPDCIADARATAAQVAAWLGGTGGTGGSGGAGRVDSTATTVPREAVGAGGERAG